MDKIRNETDLKQKIEEYYSCINMPRKMELEMALAEFRSNPQSAEFAKEMIVQNTNSAMVKFYFLTVLEFQELWSRAKYGDEQVTSNREYLWSILTGNFLSESFLKNKIAQIVADFANHEFPDHWPSYFGDVYNLHQHSLDLCLGMIESTGVAFFLNKRSAPEQTVLYDQMTNLCQILFKVFLWAVPEISGNGEQRKFRAGSSPASPVLTPGDAVRNTCRKAFEVLGQLVEVLPKYDLFWNDEMIQAILIYCTIDPLEGEFSPMALNVITDLLEKGQLPSSSSRYFPSLFRKVQDVLTYNLTNEVDEEFKSKTIAFANVFFSIHVNRAIKLTPDLLEPTLNLYVKFTITQKDEVYFNNCIETWEVMIENEVHKENHSLIRTFQTLSELLYEDRVQIDGSVASVDLLGRICHAFPQEVFPFFVQKFVQVSSDFLKQTVSRNSIQEILGISRVLGRVLPQFETPFADQFAVARSVIVQHIKILDYIQSSSAYQLLSLDLLNLSSTLFNNLTQSVPWLVQYQNTTIENETEETNYIQLEGALINVAFKWQESNSCEQWVSSSKFLSRSIEELKPDVLHKEIVARSLSNLVQTRNFPLSVCVNMWNVASTLHLVVPFGKRLSRNDWHSKSIEFQSYINPVIQEVDQFFNIDMCSHSNPRQVRLQLIYIFIVLKSISAAAKCGSNSTRDLAYEGIQKALPNLIKMVTLFCQDEEGLAHLFECLGCIIGTFKNQLSKTGKFDFVINVYELMENYMLTSPKPAADIVAHIFDTFTMISSDNSKPFDGMVERIIEFVKQLNLKLAEFNGTSNDISLNMHLLIESVIKNHWTRFFGSKIHGPASFERQQEFLRLFEILVAALTQNETDSARQVIGICKDLNQQNRFFEKELFTELILVPFATGLITLISTMTNIKEDIYGLLIEAVNNRTNYEIFKAQVLPRFDPDSLDSILTPLLSINIA